LSSPAHDNTVASLGGGDFVVLLDDVGDGPADARRVQTSWVNLRFRFPDAGRRYPFVLGRG
jgi:hypothetical protein